MLALGQTIRQRRLDLGFTLAQVAEATQTTKSYLSMIENDRVDKPPSQQVLERLEAALQLDGGALTDPAQWQRASPQVRAAVQQLAEDARRGRELAQWLKQATSRREGGGKNLDKLFRTGQLSKRVNQALGNAPPPQTPEAEPSPGMLKSLSQQTMRIPLINKVAAGYPKGFTDLDYPARIADDYVGAPHVSDPDAFALTICGDSMVPEYREGDIVVFSPLAEVEEGCDCLARIETSQETTFKRVFFEDGGARLRLQPLNPKYPPLTLPREQVAGLYRAVWKMSRL